MKTIREIVKEYKKVASTRGKIQMMFNVIAPCFTKVGGSYALKYQHEAFTDREVKDYDFIVYAKDREGYQKLFQFFILLSSIIMDKTYYDNPSVYLGRINGKKVNVILSEEFIESPSSTFEDVEHIIRIKKDWIEKYQRKSKNSRAKDIQDVNTYNNHK